MLHAYLITMAMASERLMNAGVLFSEQIVTDDDKENARRGIATATIRGAVRALINDIKRIFQSPQRGGSKGWWTEELRADFLSIYEDILQKVRKNDPSLPAQITKKASLRGEKPSDIAREYAAELFRVSNNDYLPRVLTKARRERQKKDNEK